MHAAFSLLLRSAFVSFSRWFFCDDAGTSDADFFTVDVSNDGGSTWTPVDELTTGGTGGAWEVVAWDTETYRGPVAL